MTRSSQKIETTVIGNWVAERHDGKYKMREVGTERQFTLHQESAFRWKVSGISSDGSRRRERISATTLDEAVRSGACILFPEPAPSTPAPAARYDLAEAFHTAIEASHGQEEYKRDLYRFSTYFVEWAEEIGVSKWVDVRREVVDRYVNFLVLRGLKRKSILNYLEPIRLAGRRLSASHPGQCFDPTFALRVRPDLGVDGMWRGEDGKDALTISEVLEFAAWLQDRPHGPILRAGVLLSGIMGLRLREVVFLSWNNVNLDEGFLTIQKEVGHKPKNLYSVRRLPMPNIVTESLRSLPRGSDRVVPADEMRTQHRGRSDFFSLLANFYGGVINEELKRWAPEKQVCGRDLRKTLQTHAIENANEWNVYLVDRFCGHAPKSVMEKHYFGDKKARMVELFRKEVATRLDAEIDRILASRDARMARNGTTASSADS